MALIIRNVTGHNLVPACPVPPRGPHHKKGPLGGPPMGPASGGAGPVLPCNTRPAPPSATHDSFFIYAQRHGEIINYQVMRTTWAPCPSGRAPPGSDGYFYIICPLHYPMHTDAGNSETLWVSYYIETDHWLFLCEQFSGAGVIRTGSFLLNKNIYI